MLGTVPNMERAMSEWQLLCLVMSFPGGPAQCQHSGPCMCGGVELELMSSEEVGRFSEEVCTESSGTGPGQSFEQDSTLGPEGRRDSVEEIEKQSWKHMF